MCLKENFTEVHDVVLKIEVANIDNSKISLYFENIIHSLADNNSKYNVFKDRTINIKDNTLVIDIYNIVEKEDIKTLILGLPKNMDNSLGMRANITLEFKKILENTFNIEVIMEDERLTSVISNNILIEADMSRKKRKKKVDGIAAQIILQSYLDKMKGME